MRSLILTVFVAGLLITGKGLPEHKERKSITPTHKGKIGEVKRDSIEYNQHPQKKCWHTHWENH